MYGSDRFLSDMVPGDRNRARFISHIPYPGMQLRKHLPDTGEHGGARDFF